MIIVGTYVLFVTEECIRLKINEEAKPLIILDRTKFCVECLVPGEEIEVEYYSIGFKVKTRYASSPESHDDLVFIMINGKEFRLFNKFLIWGWIS